VENSFTMYEQQKKIVEQKIYELSSKAGLKKPKVKFSNKVKLAIRYERPYIPELDDIKGTL
jgi:hypothetical protein